MARERYDPCCESDYIVGGLGRLYDFTNKEKCVLNYEMQMFSKTSRMFLYKNLPKTIPPRELERLLQMNGYAIIIKHTDNNYYAVYGGLLGNQNSPYYLPTKAMVVNVGLSISQEFEIGKNCVVIWNDSSHFGLLPLFSRFATRLVENDITLNLVDIQKRIIALLSAKDPNTKEECKTYLKYILEGKLGVIGERDILESLKVYPLSSTNVDIKDFIELEQYTKVSWLNELGLNGNYNMKRESLNSNESQLNEDMLNPLPDDMFIERQEGFERVKELFGLDISCEFADAWKKDEEKVEDEITPTEKKEGEEDE